MATKDGSRKRSAALHDDAASSTSTRPADAHAPADPSASSIASTAEFFEYTELDRKLLQGLRPLIEKHAESIVAAFYRHLLSFPETRRHLRDPDLAKRLLREQRRYLLSLAGPVIDEAYEADRRRIGAAHQRLGIEPRWYLGAYSLYLSLLIPLIIEDARGDTARLERTVTALNRVLLLDVHIAMEQYIARRQRDLQYLADELADSGRRLAQDLEEAGAALRRTTQRARAAERLASIGTLVAGLAHEIGTPMGVIQGHAKLLETAVRNEHARWRLRTIQEQIARISKIIQSLLNMARPSRTTRVTVSLEPLVENTLTFLTEKLARQRIDLVRAFEPVPDVTGDPERLQQLFLNLFLNAADAMPDGGTLRIGIAPGGESDIEIRVSDTGAGIPEEQLARVFDPFFTTKAAGEGHGLGLAVAHGIVAEHQGTIEVVRSGARGTEFRIVLPAVATWAGAAI